MKILHKTTKNNAHSPANHAAHAHAHGPLHSPLIVSKKHFQKDGKWIVKPSTTVVLVCVCGNKYIATRENQTVCIKCIARLSVV